LKNRTSIIWLGEVSYDFSRNFIREKLHPLCKNGDSFIVFCCHPPTLTFGKNMSVEEKKAIENIFKNSSPRIDLVNADRGGKATYHDRNQLMIYPVVNLGDLAVGVRVFVDRILNALVSGLADMEIEAFIDDKLLGIWVNRTKPQKLASVGFRVVDRCTDHGVALYVNGVAPEFSRFSPCGVGDLKLVSISEIINKNIKLEEMVPVLKNRVQAVFC